MFVALSVLQELKVRHIILAASALAIIGCGNTETDATLEKAADAAHDMAQMRKGIEISSAYVRPPMPGRDIGAGFLDIKNHGADDKLISASSPVSDTVEVHNHINENGVMKMRQVEAVDLPKGETVSFKPGSYHLMFYGMTLAEDQDDISVTLNYENADPVTLIIPVGEPDKGTDHSSHGSGSEYN
jgi:copper(I)-binding protein